MREIILPLIIKRRKRCTQFVPLLEQISFAFFIEIMHFLFALFEMQPNIFEKCLNFYREFCCSHAIFFLFSGISQQMSKRCDVIIMCLLCCLLGCCHVDVTCFVLYPCGDRIMLY